jgi:hypothetical protein
MNDATAAAGIHGGEIISWSGGEVTISPPSNQRQIDFEKWIALQARLDLIDMRPYLHQTEYANQFTMLTAAIASGEFDWVEPFSAAFQKMLYSEKGTKHLMLLMLLDHQPDMTKEKLEAIALDAPEQLTWAYYSCLSAAHPSPFTLSAFEKWAEKKPRPIGVRRYEKAERNGSPATGSRKSAVTPID